MTTTVLRPSDPDPTGTAPVPECVDANLFSPVHYEKATHAIRTDARTVETSHLTGTVSLRYAPRDPRACSASTEA